MNRQSRLVGYLKRKRPVVGLSVAFLLGATLLAVRADSVAAFPAHVSQTPNFATAVDFSPYRNEPSFVNEDTAFQNAMALQHYTVTSYFGNGTVEAAKANPGTTTATTADDFRTALAAGYGVVFFNGHGLPQHFIVERHGVGPRQGAADGALINNMSSAISASLFYGSNNYVGSVITDSQGFIPAGTTITAENNATNTATMSKNATGSTANDRFTIAATAPQNCTAALNAYTTPKGTYLPGQLSCGGCPLKACGKDFVAGRNDLMFTVAGIKAYFSDQNSIVFGSACYSQTLYAAGAFNTAPNIARDFAGYTCPVSFAAALRNTTLFFGRMAACDNLTSTDLSPSPCTGGDRRWTTIAAGGYTSTSPNGGYQGCTTDPNCFHFTHRPNTPSDTDLSPSVKEVLPAPAAHIAPVEPGRVVFDTKMNTTVDPAKVVSVDPKNVCKATITNARWTKVGEFDAVDFTLKVAPTNARMFLIVNAASSQALSPNLSLLDGNLSPPRNTTPPYLNPYPTTAPPFEAGGDHIGPNGDDFIWRVDCER
jgi:hypothetical protein